MQTTAKNGNGRGHGQVETAGSFLYLPDGRSVPLEIINSQSGRSLKHPPTAQSQTRESQFEMLPDGTLVDLIREGSGDIAFVVYRNGTPTFHNTFWNGDWTLIPPKVHCSVVNALRLPKTLGASETPKNIAPRDR